MLEDGVGVATGLLWLLVGLRVAGRARGEGRGGRAPLTRTGKTKGAQHGNHSRKGAVDIAGLWTVSVNPRPVVIEVNVRVCVLAPRAETDAAPPGPRAADDERLSMPKCIFSVPPVGVARPRPARVDGSAGSPRAG